MADKKYRTAYVVHNSGHNFQEVLRDCEIIKFCTTGYEQEVELQVQIETSLSEFDPDRDVIVPVGNVTANLIVGAVVSRIAGNIYNSKFCMAIYQNGEYHYKEIFIGVTEEAPDNELHD